MALNIYGEMFRREMRAESGDDQMRDACWGRECSGARCALDQGRCSGARCALDQGRCSGARSALGKGPALAKIVDGETKPGCGAREGQLLFVESLAEHGKQHRAVGLLASQLSEDVS